MLKSRYGTKKMALYSAMIDRISQALKETSEDQNTVIIILSDNGASSESI
jgi:arylsulfatase A-like enzyme